MLDEISCQAKIAMPVQDLDLISVIDVLATTTNNSFSIKQALRCWEIFKKRLRD